MGFHKGFSIGISDVTPSEVLRKLKHDILLEGFKKVGPPVQCSPFQLCRVLIIELCITIFDQQTDESIAMYKKGDLELRPGCNLLQSLEEILNG